MPIDHIRYFASVLFSAIPVALCVTQANAAPSFPQKPASAKTATAVGVLIDYGVGADSGGFDIKTSSGQDLNFAVGHDMMINGKLVQCTAPAACANWATTIVAGTSTVSVTYWKTTGENGNSVLASSEIDLVATKSRHAKENRTQNGSVKLSSVSPLSNSRPMGALTSPPVATAPLP